MYLTYKLLTESSTKASVASMLQQVQFVITPISNPDGYAYTMATGGDRMWRKNRRRNSDGTYGVGE
jgi:murein tripeptide amidase MpaA